MSQNIITTGYQPRKLIAPLHNKLKRFNVIVAHRRFGKTVFTINEMIDRALRNEHNNPQYAYFAPYHSQAKRIAWDYLKEYTKNFPKVTYNENELKCEIPRRNDKIRFLLLGAENGSAIRGMYLDGAGVDEFQDMDPVVWSQDIRPTLADRNGWAIFIGTPKGENHFYKLYEMARKNKEWFSCIYKASETKIIPQSELDQLKKEMDRDEYNQEFECSFTSAIVGSYYGTYMEVASTEGRIGEVSYDSSIPVMTYWDLGIGDTTAIWFAQFVGTEIHLIDYLEESGRGLDFYAKALKEKPYTYDYHVLPHDAKARELGTGRTREEQLIKLGIRPTQIIARQRVDDGIQAVRSILPRCWFSEKNCARGLGALRQYQKAWNNKKQMFDDRPKHDWSSHGADAFRMLALDKRQGRKINYDLPRRTVMDFNVFEV